MSDIMTVAAVPGCFGGGYMDYGRLSRGEIIRRTKELAAYEVKKWQQVLDTSDDVFDVRVVRGARKMDLIEQLMP